MSFLIHMKIPRRVIVVAALIGAVGVLAFVRLNDRVFREAAIDLRLDRDDARRASTEFLAARGVDVARLRDVVRWSTERDEIDYLERTLGLETLGPLLRDELALFGWRTRFFREGEQIEYTVAWTPDGRLARYKREWPEREPGAFVSTETARAIAEKFLADAAGLDFVEWEFLSDSVVDRDERNDHELTWRNNECSRWGGDYRVIVSLQGDTVGGFRHQLRIPEEWRRAQEATDSWRQLLFLITSFVFLAFAGIAVVLLGRAIVRRDWRWKPAVLLGSLAFAIVFANELNSLPLRAISYETTQIWFTFWAVRLGQAFLAALAGGLQAAVCVAAADVAGRALKNVGGRASERVEHAADHPFTWEYWSGSRLFTPMVLGAFIAAAKVGYVTAFYLAAKRIAGAWVPLDIPIDDLMSTVFPPLAALNMGFSASLFEETFFRLFAIAFLWRVTGSRWAAILVPAILWAFLHTNYPQQPIWIRGVELSVVGIAYGWIFLRYGLLVTLASHYFYNAFWGCWTIFDASRPGLLIQIAFVFGWPFALAWYAARRRPESIGVSARPPSEESAQQVSAATLSDEIASAEPNAVADSASHPIWTNVPFSSRRLLAVCSLALVSLAIYGIAPDWDFFGARPPVAMTRDQAARANAGWTARLGVATDGMRSTTKFRDDHDRLPAYAFENEDRETIREKYGWAFRLTPAWRTHWFADQSAKTLYVDLADSGELREFDLRLPEDEAGAMLEEDAAKDIARRWAAELGESPQGAWTIVETKKTVRPQRWDYRFVFNDDGFALADLKREMVVRVLGDRIGGVYAATYKTPEEWDRAKEEGRKHWRNAARQALTVVVVLASLVWAIVGLVRWSRRGILRSEDWRAAFVVSIVACTVPTLVGVVNRLPITLYGYWNDTSQPMSVFAAMVMIGEAISTAGLTLLGFLATALAIGSQRRFAPEWGDLRTIPAALHPRHWSSPDVRRACVAGILAIVAYTALTRLTYLYPGFGWPIASKSPVAPVAFVDVNEISRFLECVEQLRVVFLSLLLLLIPAALARVYFRATWLRILVVAVMAVSASTDKSASWAAFASQAVDHFIALGMIWLMMLPMIGRQPLAFVLLVWIDTFLGLSADVKLPYPMRHLIDPSPDTRWPSIIQLVFLMSLPLAVLLVGFLRRSPKEKRADDLAQ